MRSAIIYGTYTILNIIALFLVDHWLCRASEKHQNSVAGRVIVDFLYVVLAFMPILATIIKDSIYKYFLLRYSYIWMGFLMYFGGMLLFATVVEVIVRCVKHAKQKKREKEGYSLSEEEIERNAARSRHVTAFVFCMIILVTIGLNVYGMIHARNTVVTHYSVEIDKKVEKTEKLRVGLISDLHISYNSDVKMISNMVDKLNYYKPDVVFVTGDIFSSSYGAVKDPEAYIKALKRIKAKEGVFWVYGNHDVEEPLFCGFGLMPPEDAERTKEMVRFLKKSGFTILDDKCTAISGGEVQLVGRADEFKPVERARERLSADQLLNDIDREKPIIVLEHEPGDYKNLADNDADISFSGHTHAGQIFPGTIFTRFINDMVYGLDTRYGMQVLVTSGVGNYGPPIRIGTNSEIVITDISFK